MGGRGPGGDTQTDKQFTGHQREQDAIAALTYLGSLVGPPALDFVGDQSGNVVDGLRSGASAAAPAMPEVGMVAVGGLDLYAAVTLTLVAGIVDGSAIAGCLIASEIGCMGGAAIGYLGAYVATTQYRASAALASAASTAIRNSIEGDSPDLSMTIALQVAVPVVMEVNVQTVLYWKKFSDDMTWIRESRKGDE